MSKLFALIEKVDLLSFLHHPSEEDRHNLHLYSNTIKVFDFFEQVELTSSLHQPSKEVRHEVQLYVSTINNNYISLII